MAIKNNLILIIGTVVAVSGFSLVYKVFHATGSVSYDGLQSLFIVFLLVLLVVLAYSNMNMKNQIVRLMSEYRDETESLRKLHQEKVNVLKR